MEDQLADIIESKIKKIQSDKYATKKQKKKYTKKLNILRDRIETYGAFSLIYEEIKKIETSFLNHNLRRLRKRLDSPGISLDYF